MSTDYFGCGVFIQNPVEECLFILSSSFAEIPGGKRELEDGNDPMQTAIREVMEETGIHLAPEDFIHRLITSDTDQQTKLTYQYITRPMDYPEPEHLEPGIVEAVWSKIYYLNKQWMIRHPMGTFIPIRAFHQLVCDQNQYDPTFRSLFQNPMDKKVIFFVGYPGSGKGTQGKLLHEWSHVSTGELFRAEAKSGSALGLEMNQYMINGKIIPSKLTFDYLNREFSKSKYHHGLVLDGYPKNKECLAFIMHCLESKGLEVVGVIHFDVSRHVVESRLLNRRVCIKCERGYQPNETNPLCVDCGHALTKRTDDEARAIQERLVSYETNTLPLLAEYRKRGLLYTIKGDDLTKEATFQKVQECIQHMRIPKRSYHHPVHPAVEKTASFHTHFDGRNHQLVRQMVEEVANRVPGAQHKIYPITHLQQGKQCVDPEFKHVYDHLPNFHPIENAQDEAFATGKMGEELDICQLIATIQVAFSHPGEGVMTELEENILEFIILPSGDLHITMDRGRGHPNVLYPFTLPPCIPDQPRFELHHAVDVLKLPGEIDPPIRLDRLHALKGFEFGAWFIFGNPTHWSYRSNEFSNDSYAPVRETIEIQARILNLHLMQWIPPRRQMKISSSLENVLGIWRVD